MSWLDYADDMAARETRGQRQLSFEEWASIAARAAYRRDEAERRRFAATEEEEAEDEDVSF